MTRQTKIIIGISSAVVIGAAVLLFLRARKNKSEEENLLEGNTSEGSSGSTSGSSSSSSRPSTGFTSKAEGDAFRVWVNTKYPLYAKSILLDNSGAFDNSYIRKAYEKYGAEYKSETTSPQLLAAKYLGVPQTAGTSITVNFNGSLHKATFWNNGRFATQKQSSNGFVSKGNFIDGGKILIITEGANAGKTFKDSSVWTNLRKTL